MMSLNKKKEENDIQKWLKKNPKNDIILSDKLDGISIIAKYDNNSNITLYTRGNGEYGLDITKILKECPLLLYLFRLFLHRLDCLPKE